MEESVTDFRKMAERRRAVLSYLRTRAGEIHDKRLDRKVEYLQACGRPLLPMVFASESVGPDGSVRRGLVGRYRCGDRLCGSCAALASMAHGSELAAGVWAGIEAGLTTYHVVLTLAKPLDVSGFTEERDRERIRSFWRLLRLAWGQFSRRERSSLWVSHFRAVDWTASPGIHVGGKVVRAGLFPHFHLLVQTAERCDPLELATRVHAAWVRSIRKVVQKARRRRRREFDWIKLKSSVCEAPRSVAGVVRGGVHVRVVDRDRPDELQRAVAYAAGELVAAEAKSGKRKGSEANRLRSFSVAELLDLRGTSREGFARSAFQLYAQLVHGVPARMYSRGKRGSGPQIRERAQVVRKERRMQDPITRLEGLVLRERADAFRFMRLMIDHTDDLLRGLDEWQVGYYLPEAVPVFQEDDRDQTLKREEIAAALERLKAAYRSRKRDPGSL